MSGVYHIGERKIRPGVYYRISKKDETEEKVLDGVVAVVFRANFGPLNEIIEINRNEWNQFENLYGKEGTVDVIQQALKGGANKIVACRVGAGGTASEVTLKKSDGSMDILTLTAKYPGMRAFTVTIRDKIDSEQKECMIYDGTKILETICFPKGGNEAEVLASSFGSNSMFIAKTMNEGGELETVHQKEFTAGTNVTTTVADYAKAFEVLETELFNVICVDTEDYVVLKLLAQFLDRISDAGQFAQGVVAETSSVNLETRVEHAESFDDNKMIYVLNAKVVDDGKVIDGYQTAARIAGMVAGYPCNVSLTHKILTKVTELKENLTPTQMEKYEARGCFILSYNQEKEVWVDNAINTLIHLKEEQDKGWKKIRRTKTRQELMRRLLTKADELVGNVDCDTNGIATIIMQLNTVALTMVKEGKILSCKITENTKIPAEGDSVWFDLDVIDKDSTEHMYFDFMFRFSTREDNE